MAAATLDSLLATATEQQVSNTILMFGGLSVLIGFTLLKVRLEVQGERFNSNIGLAALNLVIPYSF